MSLIFILKVILHHVDGLSQEHIEGHLLNHQRIKALSLVKETEKKVIIGNQLFFQDTAQQIEAIHHYVSLEQYQSALQLIATLNEKEDYPFMLLFLKGKVHFFMEQYDLAAESFEKILYWLPKDTQSKMWLLASNLKRHRNVEYKTIKKFPALFGFALMHHIDSKRLDLASPFLVHQKNGCFLKSVQTVRFFFERFQLYSKKEDLQLASKYLADVLDSFEEETQCFMGRESIEKLKLLRMSLKNQIEEKLRLIAPKK